MYMYVLVRVTAVWMIYVCIYVLVRVTAVWMIYIIYDVDRVSAVCRSAIECLQWKLCQSCSHIQSDSPKKVTYTVTHCTMVNLIVVLQKLCVA